MLFARFIFFIAAIQFLNCQELFASQLYLRGQIQAGDAVGVNQLNVQLFTMGSSNPISQTNPNPQGTFELQAHQGTFELRISNLQGDNLHSSIVNLSHPTILIINLHRRQSLAQTNEAISLNRLRHKVPRKALRHYLAAHKSLDPNEAIEHLEQAIALDPDYFEALNNLGAKYVKIGRTNEASQLFERAVAMDPSNPLALSNLAFTLLRLGRFPDAERTARSAIRADGSSARARFYLALSLLEQTKPMSEILFHLARAGQEFEPARRLLQQLSNEANPLK